MLKPRLLIVELWGLGDLVIATPFLRAAVEQYRVTLMAKPFARDLQSRFLRGVEVIPFLAPWTAFKFQDKYRVWSWPWREMFGLKKMIQGSFDIGLSARWDPRDHFLLSLTGARDRIGFPRLGSQRFLTRSLERPDPISHRYEYWRVVGKTLGLNLPERQQAFPLHAPGTEVLIHSGAGQPIRVWPLPRYRNLAARLRQKGHAVQVACDPDQRDWWVHAGEKATATPQSVAELISLIDRAGVFVGNDSGPGHLAALAGVPTFTLFGPQLPEWFAPMHSEAEWVEGGACPFKPCSDYCRFPYPLCLHGLAEDEVWRLVEVFVKKSLC